MEEEWRPVANFEWYEVSNLGHVRSLTRTIRRIRKGQWETCHYQGRTLKPTLNPSGYLVAHLSTGDGKGKAQLIHRLVLEAFVGPPNPGDQGRHLDAIKTNNALWNLAWGTPQENSADIIRNGNHPNQKKDRCPRGHEYTTTKNGKRYCRKCTTEAGREFRRRHGNGYERRVTNGPGQTPLW